MKVAFIHGRPHGHPLHAAYAKSVGSNFLHEDLYLRWHDRPNASKVKRYLSWIVNALFLPNKNSYDIFLTECIRIPLLVMKKLGLMKKRQQLVALMGDESLYFISIGRYPKATLLLMKAFLNACDVIICTGEFQTNLAKKIVTNKNVKIVEVFNGIVLPSKELYLAGKFTSRKIAFLGNIESDWRIWYKGLDEMLKAFSKLFEENSNYEFHIIGHVSKSMKEHLLNLIDDTRVTNAVHFNGHSKDIYQDIQNFDLLLHTARGEAWGLTVHMAMAVGLPCIVSNITGTKELARQVDPKLVTTVDKNNICQAVRWYFDLSDEKRRHLSHKAKEVSHKYEEQKAIENFRMTFLEITAKQSD